MTSAPELPRKATLPQIQPCSPKPFKPHPPETGLMPMTNERKFMTPEIDLSSNLQSGMTNLRSCQSRRKFRSAGSAFQFTAFAAALTFFLSPATAANGELDPTGFWKTEKRNGVVAPPFADGFQTRLSFAKIRNKRTSTILIELCVTGWFGDS